MTSLLRKLGWLALGLLLLVQTGCLLAVAGVAGAGAAAGYFYYNGLLYRDYPANLGDSVSAVRTSLLELQFPILKESTDTGTAFFLTQTADGHTVRVHLDVVPSPIPIEGALTRIGVRVGFSGDDTISVRILDQVSRHLVAPTGVPPITPPPALAPVQSVTETAPPPLAAAGTTATPMRLPLRPVPVATTGGN